MSSVKDEALIPIRRRNIITNDPQTGRFNIHGILRDCMEMSLKQSNDLGKLILIDCYIIFYEIEDYH